MFGVKGFVGFTLFTMVIMLNGCAVTQENTKHQSTKEVDKKFKRISYKYTYWECNCHGIADVKYGEDLKIYNERRVDGNCAGSDIALCHVDQNGRVTAYIKDRCERSGHWGPRLFEGSSIAGSHGETVTCSHPPVIEESENK